MNEFNLVTKTEYQGKNRDILELMEIEKGYSTGGWCTYLQAKQMGYRVKKGEHGVELMRVLENKRASKKTPGKIVTDYGVRRFTVFNLDQLEKIEEVTTTV